MHMRTPPIPPPANGRALFAALLLFGGLVTLINSCGGDDLVFPGNVPATRTAQNTATPVPDDEEI
jgi:hypothetical protein